MVDIKELEIFTELSNDLVNYECVIERFNFRDKYSQLEQLKKPQIIIRFIGCGTKLEYYHVLETFKFESKIVHSWELEVASTILYTVMRNYKKKEDK